MRHAHCCGAVRLCAPTHAVGGCCLHVRGHSAQYAVLCGRHSAALLHWSAPQLSACHRCSQGLLLCCCCRTAWGGECSRCIAGTGSCRLALHGRLHVPAMLRRLRRTAAGSEPQSGLSGGPGRSAAQQGGSAPSSGQAALQHGTCNKAAAPQHLSLRPDDPDDECGCSTARANGGPATGRLHVAWFLPARRMSRQPRPPVK